MNKPLQIDLAEGDCLGLLPNIPDGSVQLVLADPPYGTTENPWDSVIPLDRLWKELRRVVTPTGAIVMTASQPFTTTLVASAMDLFKYEWIWEKNIPTGHVHAKNKPMKKHENVLVFSKGVTVHESQSDRRMDYYPQGVKQHEIRMRRSNANRDSDSVMGRRPSHDKDFDVTAAGYPHSMLRHDRPAKVEHPTQKPVDLMAYLIRCYTNKGDTVLDFCMGSGTTAVAALQMRRAFVGFERDPAYFAIATRRCREAAQGFFGGGTAVIVRPADSKFRQAPERPRRAARPVRAAE